MIAKIYRGPLLSVSVTFSIYLYKDLMSHSRPAKILGIYDCALFKLQKTNKQTNKQQYYLNLSNIELCMESNF